MTTIVSNLRCILYLESIQQPFVAHFYRSIILDIRKGLFQLLITMIDFNKYDFLIIFNCHKIILG
jgi:hypothetical protein